MKSHPKSAQIDVSVETIVWIGLLAAAIVAITFIITGAFK